MSYEHNFFVYRPLLAESMDRLGLLQDEYAAIKSFAPVENLHLTLLSGYIKKGLRTYNLQRIINNAPYTAEESFESEVVGVRIDHRARDLTRVAIKLMLDNEDSEHFFKEHEKFKKAILKSDDTVLTRRFTAPHVTLGYLDAGHGIASVRDSVEALVGSTLSVGPVESNVGKAHARVDVHYPEALSTSMVIDSPVRVLKPGAIPAGLLASLRPLTVS